MVDLAKEAFSTNNFSLAAEIYDRAIRENGPTLELFLGLADSFARDGQFSKAFMAYTKAYRYGQVTPVKLKHLVLGLINTVKQDIFNSGSLDSNQTKQQRLMFTCGVCKGLLSDPVTIPCGHTFCRKCIDKNVSKTCELCNTTHYKLKLKNIKANVVLVNLVEKLFPNKVSAASLKKQGNEFIAKGDYLKAIEVYNEAIKLEKTDHLLLSNRCHAFIALDNFMQALEDAKNCVALRPDWPKGYFRKGTALFGLGQYEDAAVAFLQCLALDQKITSAKDYLSKSLDKILSVLPPDDPKSHARAQQANPSLLQQLIDQNFSRPLLLPDISRTLTDLALIVKETICTASQFPAEPEPEVSPASSGAAACDQHSSSVDGASALSFSRNRCNSLPDCSTINHEEIEQLTKPRTHSPVSRKRSRFPSSSSTSVTEPLSPVQSSPQKISKPAQQEPHCCARHSAESSPLHSGGASPLVAGSPSLTPALTPARPSCLSVDDVECGLCYRLFFEPVTTPCGHTFCRKCLDRCLDHTTTCPMCKGNLSEYLAERRTVVTEAIQCILETYYEKEFKDREKLNDEEMADVAKMTGGQAEVPIFVCTMGFPLMSCPLHIFEPRYRLMVRQCMESGTRQFGMCMASATDEEDFADLGCMLEVRDVQYFPDGRSVLDTIGGRRFRVLSRGKRDGYNTAKVEFIEDLPVEPEKLEELSALQASVHASLSAWLAALPPPVTARITQRQGGLPDLPPTLGGGGPPGGAQGPVWAWWAIAVLPLDPQIQFALMGMTSYHERLLAIRKVLAFMSRRGSR